MDEQTTDADKVPWIRTLAGSLVPYKLHLLGASCTLGLDALLTVLRPWPLKVVIDRVISDDYCQVPLVSGWVNDPSHERTTVLAFACVTTVLIAVGTGACTYAYTMMMGTVGQGLMYTLRRRVFSHLQRLSLRFHHQRRLGDLLNRLTSDISSIRMLIARGAMNFFSNAMLMIAMLSMMLWINWQFALIACSVAPFLFLSVWWHTRQIKEISRLARQSDGELASLAQESLSMIQTVKGLGQEQAQEDRFDIQGQNSLKHYIERVRHQARMAPIVDILAAIGLMLVMWFGTKKVLQGSLTTGDIIVFFAYVTNFYSPIRAMSRQASIFTKAAVGAERVAEVLISEPEVKDRPDARSAETLTGSIVFDSVSFRYADGQPVLHNFSLRVEPGERVAILGATGAGKSTIAALLLRLYEAQSGQILLDGIDIADYTVASVRNNIGLVLQESLLFRGTIRDNILFGHPDAKEEHLLQACEAAGIEHVLQRMSDGLDSMVAERGKSLSGGQRQRVAIARAVVRQSPILLLDEPTSSLDVDSEADVITALDSAATGKTTILITHRPSTLQLVDRVIVLDAGRVVEECSPREILSRYADRLSADDSQPVRFLSPRDR